MKNWLITEDWKRVKLANTANEKANLFQEQFNEKKKKYIYIMNVFQKKNIKSLK